MIWEISKLGLKAIPLTLSIRLLLAFSTQGMCWLWLFLPLWSFFSTLGLPPLLYILLTGMTTEHTRSVYNEQHFKRHHNMGNSGLEDVGARAQEVGCWRPCGTPSSSPFSLGSPGSLPSLVPLFLSSGSTPSSTAARDSTFFCTASSPTGQSEAR